jgi:hypothetical protein
MLRITLPTREGPSVFVLEGKLAGLWVEELNRFVLQLGPGTASVFDIEDVSYVDSLGEETLLRLSRLGATFIAENVYGKDLCQRLHLQRAIEAKAVRPSEAGQRARKAPPNHPLPLSKPRRSPC